MSFSRSELQQIRDRALQEVQPNNSSLLVARAFATLAAAADHIDALLARGAARPALVESRLPAPALEQVEIEEEEEEEEEFDPSAVG